MDDEQDIFVATRYDKDKDNAPRVVAKAVGPRAQKLKAIARQYGVPYVRNISLAHALYRVDVGKEIPEELYDAVAEVLNFINQLQADQKAAAKKK